MNLIRHIWILLFAAAVGVLALPACARGPALEAPSVARRDGAGLRYLALGDSYTIGEGLPAEECWPRQLVAQLQSRGVNLAEPQIVARTGWTTGELSDALDRDPPAGSYSLVTLLVGVNDQYRGGDTTAYRAAFPLLLRRAIAWAGGDPRRVIVVSIPDWGVTPFAANRDRAAIASAIDGFNLVNRDEAARARVRYVDVTESSRRAAIHVRLVAPDGLHPSGAMYADWVSLALSDALAAIGAERR